jgi:hypothetical protein
MPKNAVLHRVSDFLMERKRYWLVPLLLVLVLFGVLMTFAEDSASSPFIYTIF